MKLQVFTAPTFSEGLAKVRSRLGRDALIVHTRTKVVRYCMGLRRREIVEITAAQGLGALNLLKPARSATKYRAAPAPFSTSAGLTRAQGGVSHCASGAPPGRALLDTPAVSNVMLLDLFKQMDGLKDLVKKLDDHVHATSAPHVPEEMIQLYTQLTSAQVSAPIAADVLRAVQRTLKPEHLQLPDFVRDKLIEQIDKMLAVAGPIARAKPAGPHIVALIGPTGVGKTTTIAKLAANLMLKDKRRVGLITNDTYRLAAIEQLRRYAQIMRAPLQVVPGADELAPAIASMREYDYVLIDTAGRSPNDSLKLGELRNFIGVAGPDEVHLVLSATSSFECLEQAMERFGDVRIDKLIFTKLDEAARHGVLLNVVTRTHKPLSYVTTGQDVPDDIEVARGRRIAQLILGSDL